MMATLFQIERNILWRRDPVTLDLTWRRHHDLLMDLQLYYFVPVGASVFGIHSFCNVTFLQVSGDNKSLWTVLMSTSYENF